MLMNAVYRGAKPDVAASAIWGEMQWEATVDAGLDPFWLILSGGLVGGVDNDPVLDEIVPGVEDLRPRLGLDSC